MKQFEFQKNFEQNTIHETERSFRPIDTHLFDEYKASTDVISQTYLSRPGGVARTSFDVRPSSSQRCS